MKRAIVCSWVLLSLTLLLACGDDDGGAGVGGSSGEGGVGGTVAVDAADDQDGSDTNPCTASGGTVVQRLCCGATTDFPDECSIGACGCAPSSSHMVMACDCPEDQCFDGSRCQ